MARLLIAALLFTTSVAGAQDISLEYQVKAAYLFNFVKFVDWRAPRGNGPISICVAGKNPFGEVLNETIRGETVNGRPLQTRVILEPDASCNVVFVPEGAAAASYLRTARGMPVLTVGESKGFIEQGGIIQFFLDQGKVRFEIDADAAERADLRISSRLLRLGRDPDRRGAQ